MKNTLDFKTIKQSAFQFSCSSELQRDLFFSSLSEILKVKQVEIIKANGKDLKKAKLSKLSRAFIERLVLDEKGLTQLASKLQEIKKMKSSIGEIIEEKTNQQGLLLRKVRVPLGVIAIIYEARPEVTIDVAALCIKSGNAAILKGGSEAINTNQILYECILGALDKAGLDRETTNFITSSDRKVTNNLLKQHKFIDLVIARGGYGLVKTVLSKSTIPVLAHAAGGARIYVDESANLKMAERIILNAKISKPAACNSLDTVIIHQKLSGNFRSEIISKLKEKGVKIMKNDWDSEFLGLSVSIKVVKNVEEAVKFTNLHSKSHSEGIVAIDKRVIDYFTKSIDAAALFINCSTRLHDGYVFGLGSEMGISTGKLHARGPVGLKELTTYKWEVHGNGQIRE